MYQKSSIVVTAQELCEQGDSSELSVPVPFQFLFQSSPCSIPVPVPFRSLFQSLIIHTVSVDVKQRERIIVALYRHQKYNTHTHQTPAVHTIHFSPHPHPPTPSHQLTPPSFSFFLFSPSPRVNEPLLYIPPKITELGAGTVWCWKQPE